ncbi:hypothetical protein Nepgr_012136 [Nepenthes gracilis]|uniref:Uncharacterized protein n=1 Tax=Nepenthes gracilis TaxID=150966 RepID=A0AAD3SF92_NEPGR|nr:hypothetical protein Nepgr_012136 [Nepenthes gracilis]
MDDRKCEPGIGSSELGWGSNCMFSDAEAEGRKNDVEDSDDIAGKGSPHGRESGETSFGIFRAAAMDKTPGKCARHPQRNTEAKGAPSLFFVLARQTKTQAQLYWWCYVTFKYYWWSTITRIAVISLNCRRKPSPPLNPNRRNPSRFRSNQDLKHKGR